MSVKGSDADDYLSGETQPFGPFGTEMNTAVMNNPEANALFLASLPVGRWGEVREIGALACYLCSEFAGYITGTDILIDGGWTAK